MELTPDKVPTGIDRAALSAEANSHLESLAFLHDHPEFVQCPQNSQVLLTEFNRAGITNPKYADFKTAYSKARNAGKLLTREKAAEIFALGTAKDIKKLEEEQGTPRYDAQGRFAGYDLPEGLLRNPGAISDKRVKQAGRTTPYLRSVTEENKNDKDYRPSKREFASWTARRQREWLEEAGYWGGDLPSYLR